MKISNRYSFVKKIQLAWWLLRTKMICANARIFRFPIDLRGKKYIDFGRGMTTGIGCRLEAFSENGESTMFFGDRVQINDYVHICSMQKVSIGNDVLMASKVYISDNSHGIYKGEGAHSAPDTPPLERKYFISPVVIEDNVWIGEGVIVLPGVKIGKGAVIGAYSVINKDIPSNVIAVGQPAKVIKQYNLDTKYWEKV